MGRGAAERGLAQAMALLDRYGVITREAAHAEGVAGGFAAVYDVLKELEHRGRVRRGYFVEGHGGAQFALPGADEQLRSLRDGDPGARPLVLAATDPANAWGALLDWPAARSTDAGPESGVETRPQRAAGALVVLLDGAPLAWMGRGEHPVVTFLPAEEPARAEQSRILAGALASLVDGGAQPALLVSTIDGIDAALSPLAGAFGREGFTPTSRGLLKVRRAPDAGALEG